MTHRVLGQSEWPRLDGTTLGPVWRVFGDDVRVIVVEDDHGEIVGQWALLPMYHAEGLGIRPDHQQQSSVLRHLWAGMIEQTHALGLESVITAADSDLVANMLESRDAIKLPDAYTLPVLDAGPRSADRARGHAFHEQLFALLPASAQHDDDPAHDAAVGRALRIGLDDHDTKRAERSYNIWAVQHGYAPVTFLGESDGESLIDIVEAVIAVDPEGHVRVRESRLPCPQ